MYRQLNLVRDSSFRHVERATGFESDRLKVQLWVKVFESGAPGEIDALVVWEGQDLFLMVWEITRIPK